ncbi:hypothetical protein AB0K08_11225 [Citricoccus sp. NPDC055426]|uniref:hypothetical protein n=1 Tax=Citricoccus sp. NPDC055426 TaxID=3155536 RepID=UPI00342B0B23
MNAMHGLMEPVRRSIQEEGLLPRLVVAGATLLTLASQHPHANFNRPRGRWDVFSSIPNWKFFAPYPATKDYHYTYRVRTAEGETQLWQEVDLVVPRQLRHALWFASRRTGKAVFDICSSLMTRVSEPSGGHVSTYPEYQLMTEFIRRQIREDHPGAAVTDFQFAIVESSGYDESEDPRPVFVSMTEPFDAAKSLYSY